MCGQTPDTLIYKNKKYDLIGIGGSELPDPTQWGMTPRYNSTACYAGYLLGLQVKYKQLFLQRMEVHGVNDPWHEINGVKPHSSPNGVLYRKMNLKVPFTGKLQIARNDPNHPFYIPLSYDMGYPSAANYQSVLLLDFKDGDLISAIDQTDETRDSDTSKHGGDLVWDIVDAFDRGL